MKLPPDLEHINPSSLKIKGRMIPYEVFAARLRHLCSSLGFNGVAIRYFDTFHDADASAVESLVRDAREDAVVVLSCRVSYNPSWGSFCGLPQQLLREKYEDTFGHCPASFIEPFLQQYRFAREHVYLTETEPGQRLVTIPEILLEQEGGGQPGQLVIALDRVAEPDGEGQIAPILVNGAMRSYLLSPALRDSLATSGFRWRTGRSIPIDRYLESDYFTFIDIERAVDHDSPFCATLLPHLGRIVSHRTPNLHAAEIHLGQEFSRAISAFMAHHRSGCGRVLCLAGLDIDMAVFQGHEGHYFVPWKAYLEWTSGNTEEEFALEQDDLYMRLMQQDRQ